MKFFIFLSLFLCGFVHANGALTVAQLELLHQRIPADHTLSREGFHSWEGYGKLKDKLCIYKEKGKLKHSKCDDVFHRANRRFYVMKEDCKYIEEAQVAHLLAPTPPAQSGQVRPAADKVDAAADQ